MPTEPRHHGLADLNLRPATADDAEEVAELFIASRRAAAPAMPPHVHAPEEVYAYYRQAVLDQDVWVVEEDTIVGFLAMTPTWLDALYVGPDRQGTGIGTALLDLAKAQRPGGFSLWVFASNAPARGFYHRNGLIELEHTDGSANVEHAPDVRMAWPGSDPVGFLRSQIDDVDGDLASLLERRLALTAAVQAHKGVSGPSDRDAEREREIVARMARLAPSFGAERIQRVVHTIIEESLHATWRR